MWSDLLGKTNQMQMMDVAMMTTMSVLSRRGEKIEYCIIAAIMSENVCEVADYDGDGDW